MRLSFFEPSGGCFSPLEIFGSLELIPVLHIEPCWWHLYFLSFPNRPVSLTPSISSKASWNKNPDIRTFFQPQKANVGALFDSSPTISGYIYFLASLCRGHISLFTLKASMIFFFFVFKCQHLLRWEKHILFMQYFIAYISQVCQRFQISSILTMLYFKVKRIITGCSCLGVCLFGVGCGFLVVVHVCSCIKHFKCWLPFAPPTVERVCNLSSGGKRRERRHNSFNKEVKISKG